MQLRLRGSTFRALASTGVVLLSALGALLLPVPLSAFSFVRVSDESLVAEAPLIVVGRILTVDDGRGVHSKPRSHAAWTEVRVRVERTLKGEAGRGLLRFRILGGHAAGGRSLEIFGAPRFAPGERAILFLEPGPGGAFRLLHFALGAFHEAGPAGKSLALRPLGGTTEVARSAAGLTFADGAAGEPDRDFAAFARWIGRRARGERPAADYLIPAFVPALDAEQRAARRKFVVSLGDDGTPVRWFDFDSAGTVLWQTYQTGQAGLSNGGADDAQTGIDCWNAESHTPVSYAITGTTSAANGFDGGDDGINAVLWNDPNGEIGSFHCDTGGVLAIGGPWVSDSVIDFNGLPYHPILSADVVMNDGLECYFAGYDRPGGSGNTAAEALLGHEFGHTLGFGHSAAAGSLMLSAIGTARRAAGCTLSADDVEAVRWLYDPTVAPAPPSPPSGLAATPLSPTSVRLDWSDDSNNETGFFVEAKVAGGAYGDLIALPSDTTSYLAAPLQPATTYTFRLRAAGATGYSSYSNEATARTPESGGGGGFPPCVATPTSLCFGGGRFALSVAWRQPNGASGVGSTVPGATIDSGLFWFFAPSNWEMMVKVLNGCAVNQRYWVFFAAASDVEYTLTILDTQSGQVKGYRNPQGRVGPVVTDTDAFAGCPLSFQ